MATIDTFKRPLFQNRPWVTQSGLYDLYAMPSILHCDAYLLARGLLKYLVMDWREGGIRQVALDAYLIEADGLTPVWDANAILDHGQPVYWSRETPWIASIHTRVLVQCSTMMTLGAGRWARCVMQAHYVRVVETDVELSAKANKYVERAPRALPLPDIL